ncbi:hypothetical protein DFH08DRAFT_809365 [Mycena albidolilacea]|uniref:Uncharacterized protein n=1 Tax=Mycena albidolilacea TaxID=1033008 RepID=A0AAD7A2C3_9AGAR|nr:hypothetical protein DFH08DRAFT_809365 [Mycena albidolilacea]
MIFSNSSGGRVASSQSLSKCSPKAILRHPKAAHSFRCSRSLVLHLSTVAVIKTDCTLMTDAEFGHVSFGFLRPFPAHNAIGAAALADHGDHSHNLVVNDPDVGGHFKWAYSMDAILTPEERAFA